MVSPFEGINNLHDINGMGLVCPGHNRTLIGIPLALRAIPLGESALTPRLTTTQMLKRKKTS
ncbi:hypothetical protein [Desulfobacter postgatei]|uniref:hypothetical protein n=1 Tax=Desulfobacter postgatei TaxID=2293 RepID=UPI00259B66D2|nr:hypothetical protein [uncultured Desulfobacter sp.]